MNLQEEMVCASGGTAAVAIAAEQRPALSFAWEPGIGVELQLRHQVLEEGGSFWFEAGSCSLIREWGA